MPLAALAERAAEPQVFHAIDRYPYILWGETWSGAEMQTRSWSFYSGSTVAISGDIERPGWRLRGGGSYGQYTYRKLVRGIAGPERMKFRGHKSSSELMLGYHSTWSKLTLKAFAGLNSEQHLVDPRDPGNAVADINYGAKGALEAWYSLSNRHWLAGELSYATTFNTYKIGLKSGYRIFDAIDLGVSARVEGDDEYLAGRAGAFTTLKIYDFSLTLGGGITGDRDMRTSPYANISLFYRF